MSLFLRNLFFTILQPGIVAGLIPYWIGRKNQGWIFNGSVLQYMGVALFIAGLTILIVCIARFGMEGKGTLSPIDPTTKLVVGGLYKLSRNPMYVGVMLILTGESLFVQNRVLWFYALAIFASFHVFIVAHEEPRLRKDFGQEYKDYCARVRRWL